ncbi:hypothetical protein F5Y15DRAFT_393047 [Xylariaceae sp. FL0016]|nr:hypothetical protein F5Y15DRAFT_393047 [Xylariaceae sp. FL0016]
MGFTSGFTGGVTLTLGVAYLTVLAHQRNREQQAAVLRRQTLLLSGLYDPLPPVLPPTRTEMAAKERAQVIETAKDRWNSEVEGAVRWAQNNDWEGVRLGFERTLAQLWSNAFGKPGNEVAKGEKKAEAVAREIRGEARREKESLVPAAKNAYANTKARSVEALDKTEDKAQEAKGSLFGALAKGVEKGKEAFGKAKDAVSTAEDKVMDKVDDKLEGLSPVEKALNQRYQKSRGNEKTVEELLRERYLPVDKQDHTNLKAL